MSIFTWHRNVLRLDEELSDFEGCHHSRGFSRISGQMLVAECYAIVSVYCQQNIVLETVNSFKEDLNK